MADIPTIIRPSWLDPGFVSALCDTNVTVIPFGAVGKTLIAKNDPSRIMLGFMVAYDIGSPPAMNIVPSSDANARGWNTAFGPNWFTLFTHGPIVGLEWYTTDGLLAPLTVIEVRASGG